MQKYQYIFQTKYTEAILSNSTRKLLWFEITKMLIAVIMKNLLCHLNIIIFGTLSFPVVINSEFVCSYCSDADVSNVSTECWEHGGGMGRIVQHKETGQQASDNRYVGSPGSRSNVTTRYLCINV